jgi:mono/diheme cytochrome c family protein
MKALAVFGTICLVFAIVVGVVLAAMVRRGFSARDEPSAIETAVARTVRHVGIPAAARDLKNPVPASADALADARAHFADHCATCHGNDGAGQTTIGQNLYPKAPDMRQADTQRLSDGELYYIIQNGVRLTGMPAWGQEGDTHDEDSWKLVHFIRHLPDLTAAELQEMDKLNPKTPDELQEEREDEEFLRGGAEPPTPRAPTKPHVHKD